MAVKAIAVACTPCKGAISIEVTLASPLPSPLASVEGPRSEGAAVGFQPWTSAA